MSDPDVKVPDLLLEQYVLGELSKEKCLEIRQLLNESADIRARVEAIDVSNKSFSFPLNRRRLSYALDKENNNDVFNLNNIMQNKKIGFVVVSCFLVLLVNPFLESTIENGVSYKDAELVRNPEISLNSEIRLKGIQPELRVYRKRGTEAVRLFNKDSVRKSDNLQLSYVSGGDKYGVIFSVDGRGDVTLHYPHSITNSAKIKTTGVTPLPYAYQLDDAPLFERFFLVTSEHPLNVGAIIKQGRVLAGDIESAKEHGLSLNKDIKQTSILLTKVEK